MKILAIRGCNLASIDGEFEVDFRKEPLSSAGIFAITGNTGAGKTTILDAMCIALYRESPRLDNIEGGDYIEQSMRVNDIRSILRKGRGRGYAEVDFLAVDGKEYRVRWSIARAHGRADGKMQSAEMYMTDLATGERRKLSAKEHQTEIPRLIGLEYPQFTRSVLLAQGRFSAFLKADEDEKAKMLSALTDTGIYSRISAAIFAKRKEAAQDIELLEAKRRDLQLLSDDEVATAKEEIESLEKEQRLKRENIEVLKAKLEWLARLAAINMQLAQAQKEVTETKQRLEKAAPEIEKLRLIDSVQPIRDVYMTLRDTALQQGNDKEQLAVYEKQLEAKNEGYEKARKSVEDAVATQERINAEYIEKQPLIAEASETEEQYAKDKRVHDELATDTKRIDAALERFSAEIAACDRQLSTLAVEHEEKSAWFEKNAHYSTAIQMIPTIVANIKAIEDEKLEVQRKEKALAVARELLVTHEKHLLQARESEEALKQTMSSEIAALRKRLVEGEPCPVCGSRHHENIEVAANLLQEEKLEEMKEANRKLIEHLEGNISNCRSEIEKLQAAIELHNSSIARNHNANLSLLAGVEDAATLLTRKNAASDLTGLYTKWNSYKERMHAITNEINVCTANKVGHHSRLQDAQKELKEKKARIEELESGMQKQKQHLASLLGDWKSANEMQQHYINAIANVNKLFADAVQTKAEIESVRGRLKGEITAITRRLADTAVKLESLRAKINDFLVSRDDNMDATTLDALLQVEHTAVAAMRSNIEQLMQAITGAETRMREREQLLADHMNAPAKTTEEENADSIKQTLLLLEGETKGIGERITLVKAQLLKDEKNREQFGKYSAEYNSKLEQKLHWDILDKLFGSATGDKLMRYAQEYTLDILLGVANEHLYDMTKRYRLARIADGSLGIKVIDLDMMAESRSAHTLSGGETFIVSLALSLALSSLSSNRMKIESLFIDEGFGALDKETLQTALMMLEKLQSSGRKVGVISHLAEMLEQIPVKVNVVKLSPGKSRVEITGKTH